MATGLHEDIVDALGGAIAAGRIPPGSVLTLAQLEAEHQASRTVVREAVRVLESIGLVSSRRRVGITVQPRERWDAFSPQLLAWNLQGPFRQQQLEALMELRVAVEPMAARLAAQRASAAERAELTRLAEVLVGLGRRGLGTSEEFLDADVAFHALLLRASGNPQIVALQTPVGALLRGRSRLGLHPVVPAPGTLEDHTRVAAAIRAGDAEEAEMLSRTHMRGVWHEVQGDGSLSSPAGGA